MEIFVDKNVVMARSIAEKVAEEGGRTFYVGGLVRDHILGRDNKDVDIEIHGITPEKLSAILESLGEVTKTGMSFGVFGLKKYEIDIAMPRTGILRLTWIRLLDMKKLLCAAISP